MGAATATEQVTDDELAEIVRRAINVHGAKAVGRALGLSAEATCRLGGRMPTQPGTRDRARLRIGQLATLRDVG